MPLRKHRWTQYAWSRVQSVIVVVDIERFIRIIDFKRDKRECSGEVLRRLNTTRTAPPVWRLLHYARR
jgi:hypothetical protein